MIVGPLRPVLQQRGKCASAQFWYAKGRLKKYISEQGVIQRKYFAFQSQVSGKKVKPDKTILAIQADLLQAFRLAIKASSQELVCQICYTMCDVLAIIGEECDATCDLENDMLLSKMLEISQGLSIRREMRSILSEKLAKQERDEWQSSAFDLQGICYKAYVEEEAFFETDLVSVDETAAGRKKKSRTSKTARNVKSSSILDLKNDFLPCNWVVLSINLDVSNDRIIFNRQERDQASRTFCTQYNNHL